MTMQLGADPTLIRDELLHAIGEAVNNSPRSLQAAVGPSELGTPCARKLGHRLARTPPTNVRTAWRTAVGTAVHAYVAGVFDALNADYVERVGEPRYDVERRVTVGEIDGVPIEGSCDLFDRVTGCVIDWKVVGLTSLRAARTFGPREQYRTQIHCYARGFVAQGRTVERVAVMWLPQSGELYQSAWWSEPYSESVALQALQRAEALLAVAKIPQALAALPRADDFCVSCAYFRPTASVTDATACSGYSQNGNQL